MVWQAAGLRTVAEASSIEYDVEKGAMKGLGRVHGERLPRIRVYRLENDQLADQADRWEDLKPLRSDWRYRFVIDGQQIDHAKFVEHRAKRSFPEKGTGPRGR